MPKMTFTSPRATLEETLAFANAVREAGGGNPLDALMPAIPADPHQCLIAKNLNFNCEVRGIPEDDINHEPTNKYANEWAMFCGDDKVLRDRIAEALELTPVDSYWEDDDSYNAVTGEYRRIPSYAVLLPKEIGQVASDFDQWSYGICGVNRKMQPDGEYGYSPILSNLKEEIERTQTFAPYVLESIREAKAHGVFNDKGELVL